MNKVIKVYSYPGIAVCAVLIALALLARHGRGIVFLNTDEELDALFARISPMAMKTYLALLSTALYLWIINLFN